MNEALRESLLTLARHDLETRARLAADGSLFDGYHPEMQAVHDANADALEEIIAVHGWPGVRLAGEDGAEAAWLIVQHAIARPPLQRRSLVLIQAAAAEGDAPAWQAAYLADRIRVFEGRPQLYGTSFDWNEAGEMEPNPIEEPDRVDERRADAGLPPLAETAARIRSESRNEPRPADLAARRREMAAWAASVGWRAS